MISPKQILALEALNEENSHVTFQSKLSEYQKPKQSGGVISFDGFKAPHFKDSGAPATDGSDDIFDAQVYPLNHFCDISSHDCLSSDRWKARISLQTD